MRLNVRRPIGRGLAYSAARVDGFIQLISEIRLVTVLNSGQLVQKSVRRNIFRRPAELSRNR